MSNEVPQQGYAAPGDKDQTAVTQNPSSKRERDASSNSESESDESDGEGSGSGSGSEEEQSEEEQYNNLYREVSHLAKAYGHSNIDDEALQTLTALAGSNAKIVGNEIRRQTHSRCFLGIKTGGPVLVANTLGDDTEAQSNAIAWIKVGHTAQNKEEFPPR